MISSLTGWLSYAFLGTLAFLFVLTAVVFVHELGHFLVARWCGVKVQTFSIGFGREIWGRTDRHGTRWRLSWLPLGGYVKFLGDENVASAPSREALARMTAEERAGSFHAKPLVQRAAVVAAGPLANFLFAIVIFAVLFLLFGVPKLEPRVGKVIEGMPAAAAGFMPGDLVLSINGRPVDDFSDLVQTVSTSAGEKLTFAIDRAGTPLILTVTPEMSEQNDRILGKHRRAVIGIQPPETASVSHTPVGPAGAVKLAAGRTWDIVANTFSYMGGVVSQRQSADQFGGPILIAQLAGRMAQAGPEYVVELAAFLSVSIGLINLMPIPLLDGGHLLFYAIEAVRRRPLGERAQEFGLRLGLAIILLLFLLANFNDLKRLFASAS